MKAINNITVPGKSTVFLSENFKSARSPVYINVSGAADISVDGRGAIIIDSKNQYSVNGKNVKLDLEKRKAKEQNFTKGDYVHIDKSVLLRFQSKAFVYVRGNAKVDIQGEATFDRPSIIIRYVELIKGATGLSIVTSIGALNYLLVSSYGSHSYSNFMDGWLNGWLTEIADYTLIISIILLGLLFTYSLWFLLADQFKYSEKKDYHLLDKHKPIGYFALGVAGFALYIGVIAASRISEISTYALLASLILFSGYILVFVIYDIVRREYAELAVLICIMLVALTFWINTYLDSVKSALVADAQYCYWLSQGKDVKSSVCTQFNKSYKSYRVKEQ